MTGYERVVKVMQVVIAQFDAVNAGLGIYMNQWSSEIEGAFQRLEFVRPRAPRRIVWLWIGFTPRNRWEDDRLVE